MTPRERLQTVLRGEIPDCVPVSPDFSNMIPARLTGKPFWDLYLYKDPPIWEAYVDCAKRFDIDSLMDGYFPLNFQDPRAKANGPEWKSFIVSRSEERIITQEAQQEGRRMVWKDRITVYPRDNPPSHGVKPEKIGLPPVPQYWEPLEGVKQTDTGPEGFRRLKERMGQQGLVGAFAAHSCALGSEEDVYRYYDNPDKHEAWAEARVRTAEARFAQIMAMPVRPDFLCVGGSGTLIWQTVEIFRQLAFPAVKRVIELATQAGMPTHIHSCGPEKELVRIMATETGLSVIDPLEVPPMGDCDLADLKRRYGDRLTLKGNLHTTNVMLQGSVSDVIAASRKAIDDAAAGGRFILSTGDQCGRDTPDQNIRAMVETARSYGRYDGSQPRRLGALQASASA